MRLFIADEAICTKYSIDEGFLVLHKLVQVGGSDPENEVALASEDEQRERDNEVAAKKAQEEASALAVPASLGSAMPVAGRARARPALG